MILQDEVIVFNFYNIEIIEVYDEKEEVIINVGYRKILCLHLYDQIEDSLQAPKKRKRKITMIYPNGEKVIRKTLSNDDVCYSAIGPIKVIVGKLKRRYL